MLLRLSAVAWLSIAGMRMYWLPAATPSCCTRYCNSSFSVFVCLTLQGMDYELPESAMQQLRDVAGDVSMRFRCAACSPCMCILQGC